MLTGAVALHLLCVSQESPSIDVTAALSGYITKTTIAFRPGYAKRESAGAAIGRLEAAWNPVDVLRISAELGLGLATFRSEPKAVPTNPVLGAMWSVSDVLDVGLRVGLPLLQNDLEGRITAESGQVASGSSEMPAYLRETWSVLPQVQLNLLTGPTQLQTRAQLLVGLDADELSHLGVLLNATASHRTQTFTVGLRVDVAALEHASSGPAIACIAEPGCLYETEGPWWMSPSTGGFLLSLHPFVSINPSESLAIETRVALHLAGPYGVASDGTKWAPEVVARLAY